MTDFTLVSGNSGKVSEYHRLLDSRLSFDVLDLDLDELQSLDSNSIVEHKVRQAYANVQKPVVVEDVSAGVDRLNGLPGPFIKFFEQRLGKEALYLLAGERSAATITCTIGPSIVLVRHLLQRPSVRHRTLRKLYRGRARRVGCAA